MRDLNDGSRFASNDFDHAINAADLCLPLRLACLKELFNARQTCGDVHASDTARMERSHRELRTRLADRLCRHDAYGFTEGNDLARCKVAAVAGLADARRGNAAEW